MFLNKLVKSVVSCVVKEGGDWNVGNLTTRYIDVIENKYNSHNYNIFIVIAELPAIISILKRFTIYLIVGCIVVILLVGWIYYFNVVDFLIILLNGDNNNLQFFFSSSVVLVNKFSIFFFLVFIKFILIFHLLLNCLLFGFYYLNSFLLLQKYNSVDKFRGNDVIVDSLDIEHDGISRVMWRI